MRQPFSIDRLPLEWREVLQHERSLHSWLEIEEITKSWKWDKLEPEIARLFPKDKAGARYIPHSNLQRWYDVRVEQALQEIASRAAVGDRIAAAFAVKSDVDWPEAVRNGLSRLVFTLLDAAKDPKMQGAAAAQASDLGWLLAQQDKVRVQQLKLKLEEQRIDIERRKLEQIAAKVKGLKGDVEKKKLSPEQLQKRLDDIYGITA